MLKWKGRGLDVYGYFNNDAEGNAVVNARELIRVLNYEKKNF